MLRLFSYIIFTAALKDEYYFQFLDEEALRLSPGTMHGVHNGLEGFKLFLTAFIALLLHSSMWGGESTHPYIFGFLEMLVKLYRKVCGH